LQAYGGKDQYVKWAWQEGTGLSSSNDSFFYDPSIRSYYKTYVKVSHLYPLFFLPRVLTQYNVDVDSLLFVLPDISTLAACLQRSSLVLR
jgi:hypothetical protein